MVTLELTKVKEFEEITARNLSERKKYEKLCKRNPEIWKRTRNDYVFWKKKDPDKYFEEYIRARLKDFGFDKVISDDGTAGYGGDNFKIGGWQIDACGKCDGIFVLIDCATTQKKYRNITQKAHEWRSKCSDIAKKLKDRYREEFQDIKYVIWTNFPTKVQIQDVYVKDDKYLKYYEKLFTFFGDNIKYSILRELGVTQIPVKEGQESDFIVPAFRITYQDKHFYNFFVNAEILRKIAYVCRLESQEKAGFQRMLDEKKLIKIGAFLDKGGMFYNNIIIAFENEPKFIEEKSKITTYLPNYLQFGALELPKVYCSAWVIDGQHRLFGFTRSRSPLSKQQTLLNVFAIYNSKETKEEEEAETFYVINSTQTKIKPDILWDLIGRIRPKTFGGLISNIVKTLNEKEPFKDKIYIPSISGIEKRGHIPISYFCTDLKNLRLIGDVRIIEYRLNKQNDDIKTPVKLLIRYFKIIQDLFEKNKEVNEFIFTHNGVSIMLEILKGILIKFQNELPSESELRNLLNPMKRYIIKNFNEIKRQAKAKENRREIAQKLLQKILRKEYTWVMEARKREKKIENQRGKIDYGV